MAQKIVSDFPPIEAAYDEEFGKVDHDVYEVAKQIWTPAESLAVALLHDSPKGMQLMLKAVAKVSSARKNKSFEIANLRSYLYQTFKHLVWAELKKEKQHQEKLDNWFQQQMGAPKKDEEGEINKKILINELRSKMDDWTREVFDLLCLGYSYEDLVPKFGSAANVVRSKFSKKTARLARDIQTTIKSVDDEINQIQ
jgi:hypothetical protein